MSSSHNKRQVFIVLKLAGILAVVLTLAELINSFKHRYNPRAKQSEAKIQLLSVYSVEAVSKDTYGTYSTCLKDLGYETPPRGYYIVGFSKNSDTSFLGKKCTSASYVIPETLLKASKDISFSDLPNSTTTKTTFKAFAIGRIMNSPDYPLDIWSIDENKNLVHVQDGSLPKSFFKRQFRQIVGW